MFFRTIRSPLLDRRNYLSLCSCVLRLGSQYLRSFWMRQILYWSQIYNVMPWLLMTWTDSLFSSGFGSFTWIYTCFPYLWVVYLDYCFSASLSLWVVWFLALTCWNSILYPVPGFKYLHTAYLAGMKIGPSVLSFDSDLSSYYRWTLCLYIFLVILIHHN